MKDQLEKIENIKRQWLATIDALSSPLMVIDQNYKIYKANLALAKKTQIDIKKLSGKKCHQVFFKSSKPCSGCQIQKTLKTKQSQSFRIHSEHHQSYFDVASNWLEDSQDKNNYCVQIYQDRSKEMQLQNSMTQSEKLASIGLLASGIAHEISNPLGGALLYTQSLLEASSSDSKDQKNIQEIEKALLRCKDILDQLLDFARVDDKDSSFEAVDVAQTIRQALKFCSYQAKRQNVSFIDELPKQTPKALAHKNKLVQVFLNLIQNSLYAMPKGGSLSVSYESRQLDQGGPMGVWKISDTGSGIAKEHLNRIFEPFFTTKEPGQGTGLGLFICYNICQELKGQLLVQSTEFKGSCFEVLLPLKS